MNPTDLKYSKEHEWVKAEGENVVKMGITQYAQEQLGDVVFLDLPKPGAKVQQFKKLGEVESVKAVSDIFSPVSGEVVEANPDLQKKPESVNTDPYNAGWLLRIRLSDPKELDKLLTAEQYESFLKEGGAASHG